MAAASTSAAGLAAAPAVASADVKSAVPAATAAPKGVVLAPVVPFDLQRVTSLDDDERYHTDPSDPFDVRPSSPLSPRLIGDQKTPPLAAASASAPAGALPPLQLSDAFIVQLTTHQHKPINPLHKVSEDELDILSQLLGRNPNEYPTKPAPAPDTTASAATAASDGAVPPPATVPVVPPLTSLNLSHNALNDAKVTKLCPGLAANRTLTTLKLCSNKITDVGATALATALRTQSGLLILDLYRNLITEDGCVALSEVVESHPTLQFLSLNNNSVGSKRGLQALGAAMRRNTSLISLSLTQVGLTGEVLGPLSLALTTNKTLRNLNLSTNSLDVNCCNALRILLESANSCLATLDVSSCRLTPDAMRILAVGLASKNCQLTTLAAGSNEIGSVGLQHILTALTVNRKSVLTSLVVFRNKIGADGAKALGTFLLKSSRLSFLHIGHNKLGDAGLKHLLPALRSKECVLSVLFVSFNQFTPAGIVQLVPVLQANRSLIDFRCPGHEIKETDEAIINNIMKRNKDLQAILQQNWMRISVLMSFIRANRDNKIKNSILPLIPVFLETTFAGTPAGSSASAAVNGPSNIPTAITGLPSAQPPALATMLPPVISTTAASAIIPEARQTRLERFMNCKYYKAVINSNPTD